MDPETITIGGIALMPLIIALIQILKRFFPTAPDNVWLGLSMLFGILGQTGAYIGQNGVPVDLNTWLSVTVTGFWFGLAVSKAYDLSKEALSHSQS